MLWPSSRKSERLFSSRVFCVLLLARRGGRHQLTILCAELFTNYMPSDRCMLSNCILLTYSNYDVGDQMDSRDSMSVNKELKTASSLYFCQVDTRLGASIPGDGISRSLVIWQHLMAEPIVRASVSLGCESRAGGSAPSPESRHDEYFCAVLPLPGSDLSDGPRAMDVREERFHLLTFV